MASLPRAKGTSVALLTLAVIFAGCETQIITKEIAPGTWWVCDSGEGEDSNVTCGANPEKGIARVCVEKGRTVEDIDQLPDNSLLVMCGETQSEAFVDPPKTAEKDE